MLKVIYSCYKHIMYFGIDLTPTKKVVQKRSIKVDTLTTLGFLLCLLYTGLVVYRNMLLYSKGSIDWYDLAGALIVAVIFGFLSITSVLDMSTLALKSYDRVYKRFVAKNLITVCISAYTSYEAYLKLSAI
ncbi:TPA: hypothetical protein ACPVZC_004456 [Vibrio parahaemolyticus]